MHDPKLYEQVKQFCQNGIVFVAKQLSKFGDRAPTKIAERFIIVDDHTTSHKQDIVIDWSWLIINLEKDLQQLESYKKAVSSLNSHKVFGKQLNNLIGTSDSMRRIGTDELLRILITTLLMETNKTTFDEKQFNKLYSRVEKFFYTDTLHLRYFAPISNFSMEKDHLKLAPNFTIIKITKEEKEKLMSTSSAFHSTYQLLASKEFAFEFYAKQPKVIGERSEDPAVRLEPQQKANSWFRTACSALRLYKPGLIGFNHVWILDNSWDFMGVRSVSSNAGPTDFFGDHMTLSASEIPEFLELWKRYGNISQRKLKKILNAVARLNFGTERNRAEDKLVDYFVGFESLFLNDDNPELKYRLALSVAHWLGSNHVERKKIYKIVNRGYDQRSTIVHGGEPEQMIRIDSTEIDFTKHTKLIEDYLRSAIKKFIIKCADNNKKETQLIEELRDKVLE